MELLVKRFKNAVNYSAGKLYINGEFFSYTLEDTNRFLTSEMSEEEIKKVKVPEKTAIPRGKYEVVINFSNHFKKQMPLLIGVKGFAGVRIHSGNKPEHTEGCLLVGFEDSSDGFIGQSKDAETELYKRLFEAIKTEKIWITYE